MYSRNKEELAGGLCVGSVVERCTAFFTAQGNWLSWQLPHQFPYIAFFAISPYFKRSIATQFSKSFQISAWLILASFVSLSAQAASPFTTEGKFSVGSDGSANYSIPIVVPPGTAGMQPQLALSYNSNGGNGIVGMGWGIDGLSQIGRCPTTLEQDGVINGVNYTNTDRFCLDGQRLIAITDTYNATTKQYTTTSAYGANGTEYRTESANFAKIISYGQAGTGPAHFKVWTKSGQIIEYGNTADSGIEAQGKPTIRTWGVNKISDTRGNYISVSYTEDNANGEAYVQKIDYTGNASSTPALAPYANIQFIYEARPDINTAYQAGSILKTTKRLTNIQTYNGTTQIKNYKLAYELSQTTNRSRLKSVQECDGNNTTPICKLATTFSWPQTGSDLSTPNYAMPTMPALINGYRSYHSDAQFMQFADFNGDGLTDYMWIPFNGDGRWLIAYATGIGFTLPNYAAPVLPAVIDGYRSSHSDAQYMHFADFNGDGKTDYMWIPLNGDGRWLIAYATSTGFTSPIYAAPVLPALIDGYRSYHSDAQYMQFADFNGDGKTDYMWIPFNGDGRWVIAYSTGTGFTAPSYASPVLPALIDGYNSHHSNAQYVRFVDVNGDGKTDYMWIPLNGDGRWLIAYSTGNGFTQPSYAAPALPALIDGYNSYHSDAQYMRFVDLNGDGLIDYMWIPHNGDGRWLIAYSTGNGFTQPSYAAPVLPALIDGYRSYHSDAQYMQFADFNGDGKTDYMWIPFNGDGRWVIAKSTGTGFTSPSYAAPVLPALIDGYRSYHSDAQYMQFADFNGDGKTDYMWIPFNGDGRWVIAKSIGLNDVVLSIKPSDKDSIDNTYSFIVDGAIYTKDTDSIYPMQDIQSPMNVVSSTSLSDAIGGLVTTNYQYGGLKSHLRGRGSLGFRYVKESSPDSGLSVTTFYRQDFPFTGLPSQVEKRRLSDNALLSVVQNTYANSDLATSTIISKFPYLSQSVEQAYELDGALVSTTTTTNQYDNYGNVTSVKVDDGLGNIKTTTSIYSNDVGNWLLGRLIRSTVTSVTP